MQNQFTKFEESFLKRLSSVNISSISDDKIVTDYLNYLINHKKYFLKIYSFVLAEALKKSSTPIKDLSILDFGCGNGLLALFAKHCGFKHVYACDYYENFIKATKTLSSILEIEIDGFQVCNEYDLSAKFSTNNIDIIIGTDVIEHIYNLDIFFTNINTLNKNIVSAFTTASVHDNFFKRKKLEKLMLKDELEYEEIRKNIIQKHDSTLDNHKLEKLAITTRGLKENDIVIYVDEFNKTGTPTLININRTNTCDPITGNFTERILTIKEYRNIYNKHNLYFETISGFYDEEGNWFRKFALKSINIFLKIFNKEYISRVISPFILLIGKSNKIEHAG